MKSAKTITRYRRYTTRINVILACILFGTMISSYADYRAKLIKHPNLPLAGMFFKLKPNSWDQASSFNDNSK